MEEIGRASLEYVIRFLEDRATAPAVDIDGAYEVAASLRTAPPEQGRNLTDLLDEIDRGPAGTIVRMRRAVGQEQPAEAGG